jgi:aspartate aminotransferase-like enzyme
LVQALDAAVRQPDWPAKMAAVAAVSARLRRRLLELGFNLIAQDSDATPGVVTIALPPSHNSTQLGQQLQKAGYLLSYNSDYLRQRNWIQICLMGEFSPEKLESLTTWLVKNALPTPATPPVRAAVASYSGESKTA